MESQRCKGARDLLPDDMDRFRQVEDAFRSSCLNWGYREVRTPTLEYIHLFTAAGTLTPAMLGRVYSFLDWDGWGGERVVLRPDGTIPAARLYSENLADQALARIYYITNIFAFEETGRENREKWQCGVELLGDSGPASEAEIISLALEVLNTLGITRPEIKLSHAGVLKALIADMKLVAEAKSDLLDEILEGNWEALAGVNGGNKKTAGIIKALMGLKGKSGGFLSNLKAMPGISPAMRAELAKFAGIVELLDTLGCKYEIDFTSIKGFEYYTGLCFKLRADNTKICSGGRYDSLVKLVGSKDIPACGLAFYLDELAGQVKPYSLRKAEKTVLVRSRKHTPAAIKAAFTLAGALRRAGLIAEFDFRGSQLTARWIVTVSDTEEGFLLKDNAKGASRKIGDIASVISVIGGFGKRAR
jgi:histidyl-tRNA synthetase